MTIRLTVCAVLWRHVYSGATQILAKWVFGTDNPDGASAPPKASESGLILPVAVGKIFPARRTWRPAKSPSWASSGERQPDQAGTGFGLRRYRLAHRGYEGTVHLFHSNCGRLVHLPYNCMRLAPTADYGC